MTDLQTWANCTQDELYEHAKKWAKLYTTKMLRASQNRYENIKEKNPNMPEIDYKGIDNMWQCATFAISIREFGE